MTGDPACVEVVELITDYMEGALPPERAQQLERHLEGCPGCDEYLRQMRMVAAALRRND
jgi:anti-sigma factor RsiW